jgi:hypothetical protein
VERNLQIRSARRKTAFDTRNLNVEVSPIKTCCFCATMRLNPSMKNLEKLHKKD